MAPPPSEAAPSPDGAGPRHDPVEEPPLLLYVIKQLELLSRNHLTDVLRPAGVTVQQYTALTVLDRRGALSSSALARSSFVTAQSMAEIVRALEDRGLIERHRDETNRRQLLIGITAPGRQLLDDFAAPVAHIEQLMVSALTAHQTATLRRYLESCRAALEGRGR